MSKAICAFIVLTGCSAMPPKTAPPQTTTPLDPRAVVSVTRIQNKPSRADLDMGIYTVPDTVITKTADGATTVHTDLIHLLR